MARTYLALVACVLFACLPSGLLHLTVCDCNGVVVESHADPCPCELQVATLSGCCASERDGCSQPGGCCGGGEDGDPEPEDSCCTDLLLPDLLSGRGSVDVPEPADRGPQPPFVAVVPDFFAMPRAFETLREATGPPGWHRTRRALAERAAVVLLI